jgi:hypothetical protein
MLNHDIVVRDDDHRWRADAPLAAGTDRHGRRAAAAQAPAPAWNGSMPEGAPAALGDASQQYAVVLLNQDQMAQLLQRPPVRAVGPRLLPAVDAYTSYTRMMQRARVAIVALGVLVAGASAWAWAPRPVLSVLPWTRGAIAPTVSTGASFSVTVASPRGAASAAAMASRLMAMGVPAFTRAVPNKDVHQVMVGPYVSLDEAEGQQRRLTQRGYGSTRLFVDDSLRHAPRNAEVADAVANPGVVLAGAPGRLALALEMRSEPRRVNTTRVDDNTIDIEIGPVDGAIDAQQWSAPEGVHLVRQVSVEEVAGEGTLKYARARLNVPEFTRANTRVEGRRIYVDLTWPQEAVPTAAAAAMTAETTPAPQPAAMPAPAVTAAAVAPAATLSPAQHPAAVAPAATVTKTPARPAAAPVPVAAPAGSAPNHAAASPAAVNTALASIAARFERAVPFVQSAAKSPSPDVFAALAPTVSGIEASLREITATGESNAARGLLLSAAASARRAIDPDFLGSRIAESQQAAGLVDAAKALIPATAPAR